MIVFLYIFFGCLTCLNVCLTASIKATVNLNFYSIGILYLCYTLKQTLG